MGMEVDKARMAIGMEVQDSSTIKQGWQWE